MTNAATPNFPLSPLAPSALVEPVLLANRLMIPKDVKAILWDMDGVLIDSLGLDLTLCSQLLSSHFQQTITLDADFIASLFAFDPRTFWEKILSHVQSDYRIDDALTALESLLEVYETERREATFPVNPGIVEILEAAQQQGLPMAVVSNNITQDIEDILQRCGLRAYFDTIVGNDIDNFRKKPAPDTYQLAAKHLGVATDQSLVVEDSLLGAQAGFEAGCRVASVATGGTRFDELEASTFTHDTYETFHTTTLTIQFGDVRKKTLASPNDFVSHMVEHIAWRLGVEINLDWKNNNWVALGAQLGALIKPFDKHQETSAALGMIDDGSAEVYIDTTSDEPGLYLGAMSTTDLDWFLSLRCEQIDSGASLVELMQGLAFGLGIKLCVKVCSVEDPHHAWEGVFRAIGIALNRIYTPKSNAGLIPANVELETFESTAELRVLSRSLQSCKVFRGTAESHVVVNVDFTGNVPNQFNFNVADNIDVDALPELLTVLCNAAGFTMQVDFNATVLNSSHVVAEDTALVLGRALLEILSLRMMACGVNGAGSSLRGIESLSDQVQAGISVEGRKFWLFVPGQHSMQEAKQRFLIGQDVMGSLRSEDLDDFIDGLSGGLACSIIVHLHDLPDPNIGWTEVFEKLGMSLQEIFAPNPYRKGVPPGVKATLA